MLKNQSNELRSSFKSLSVSASAHRPHRSVDRALEAEILPPRTLSDDLLPSEIDVLRRSIDKDRLAENGWDVQPNGSIIDDTGTSVLPPGFVSVVTRIISK